MIGEKRTYLYPKNMRSSKDGWGNFFIVKMYKGSKWLGHSTKDDSHRVMISTVAYEALIKDAKANRIRYAQPTDTNK